MSSVATLSNSVNKMATRIGPNARDNNANDVKPPANGKMASNATNSVLTKKFKKERK